jgi:type II secretory pathway pseudopilin PulG
MLELMIVMAVMSIIAAMALPPLMAGSRASNERNASASLKSLHTAEYDLRTNDRDGNRVVDFWTADVYALNALIPVPVNSTALPADSATGTPIRLIEPSLAAADGLTRTTLYGNVPVSAGTGQGAAKAGYVYRAFTRIQVGSGTVVLAGNTDGANYYGNVHHADAFAFMAFPLNRSLGGALFVMGADGVVWRRGLGTAYAATFTPVTVTANSSSTVTGTGVTILNSATTFPKVPATSGLRRMD